MNCGWTWRPIYGIELLNAKAQLRGADQGRMVFLNEATGIKKEMALV
jgi:hypothetical protein